mmetsp:Transcript_44294/g.110129  ORF Transcript_44294/g.110129 Transcript_44294/m.110129 type:complete len:247 (+) Transcript_44294:36-776(+)
MAIYTTSYLFWGMCIPAADEMLAECANATVTRLKASFERIARELEPDEVIALREGLEPQTTTPQVGSMIFFGFTNKKAEEEDKKNQKTRVTQETNDRIDKLLKASSKIKKPQLLVLLKDLRKLKESHHKRHVIKHVVDTIKKSPCEDRLSIEELLCLLEDGSAQSPQQGDSSTEEPLCLEEQSLYQGDSSTDTNKLQGNGSVHPARRDRRVVRTQSPRHLGAAQRWPLAEHNARQQRRCVATQIGA